MSVNRHKYDVLKERAQRWRQSEEDLQIQMNKISTENQELAEENSRMLEDMTDERGKVKKLTIELQSKDTVIRELRDRLQTSNQVDDNVLRDLRTALNEAEQKVYDESRQVARRDHKIEDLQEKLDALKQDYSSLKEENKESNKSHYEQIRELEREFHDRIKEVRGRIVV
jgi:chromosome segregation ATPase